jgi:hypothetical protein
MIMHEDNGHALVTLASQIPPEIFSRANRCQLVSKGKPTDQATGMIGL